MRNKMIIGDYGPSFKGWVGRTVDGSLVCVAAPGYEDDPDARALMRELAGRQGGDCHACDECPIGGLFGIGHREKGESAA